MRRGEIWWAELPPPAGPRPVLLLHRDAAYQLLSRVIIAQVTRTIRGLPSCVLLTHRDGMPHRCEINLDTMTLVRRELLIRRIASLRREKISAVDAALRFVLAL